MEDVIVPLFARLDLQASSYVSQRPTQLQIPSRKSRVFSNTEQARHDLTRILSTVYHFLATEAQPHKYCRVAAIPIEVKEQRSRLIADLDQWRKPFDVLLSNASVTLTYSKLVGAIIHPLYLTARKCRNPRIRRRAVVLLSSTGREGIWDGPFRARVAQRLIELEESGARAMPGGKIPESARIHRTDIRTDRTTGRRWVHVVWTKDAGFREWVVVTELLSSFLEADGFADARWRRLSSSSSSSSLVITEIGPLRMR